MFPHNGHLAGAEKGGSWVDLRVSRNTLVCSIKPFWCTKSCLRQTAPNALHPPVESVCEVQFSQEHAVHRRHDVDGQSVRLTANQGIPGQLLYLSLGPRRQRKPGGGGLGWTPPRT